MILNYLIATLKYLAVALNDLDRLERGYPAVLSVADDSRAAMTRGTSCKVATVAKSLGTTRPTADAMIT